LRAGWKIISMVNKPMHILQINTMDMGGGAAKIAWSLFCAYRAQGHVSQLAVGNKRSDDADIMLMFDDDCRNEGKSNHNSSAWQGYEDFNFPGTWKLFSRTEKFPDVIHCHNLHGDYFDLRVLPWLSRQAPVFLTLHDAWLLSGHCAHSFDCERWKKGCGKCPDLTTYPAILQDTTACNWQLKKKIFSKSRFYVAVPSQWLMDKVKQSMLEPSVVEAKIIPNGVDLSIFHPAQKRKAREILSIPEETRMLLFAADGIRQNIYKDYKTLQTAVEIVAEQLPGNKILFMALGENAHVEQIGKAEVHFIPYQQEPWKVACYYHAADIYLHGAHIDTFPNTVLEALSCGTPVVATAVGGIPEQIDNGNTGFLTPPGNPDVMADRIKELLENVELRQLMGQNAAEDAVRRFDIKRMAREYLDWYQEILETWKKAKQPLYYGN
jgi:glycosyltransferase involved in cell wall biosynthesis